MVTDRPLGDSSNSDQVCTSRTATIHHSDDFSPFCACMAAGIMMRKEIPTPTRAIANFIGVEGARSANFVQSAAKMGAKMMMKTGLID